MKKMAGLSIAFVLALPFLSAAPAAAQTQGRDSTQLRNEQLDEAYAACGGPAIQGGRPVQPTPERDRCLEEHLRQNSQQQASQGSPERRRQPDNEQPQPQKNR